MTYIIGYSNATIANDFVEMFVADNRSATILDPNEFYDKKYDPTQKFVVAITRDVDLRKNIIETIENRGLEKDTYIHPTAVIHNSAKIEPGTVIYPFATALWKSHIGQDCLITPYCMIAHESTVGQGSFLQPGTLIAGSTKIGKYCKFGLSSNIIDHLIICDFVTTGANALVTKNITQPGVYLGSPARKIAS